MKYLLILLALGCGGQKDEPEQVFFYMNPTTKGLSEEMSRDYYIKVYPTVWSDTIWGFNGFPVAYDVSPYTLKECLVEPGKLCKEARRGL